MMSDIPPTLQDRLKPLFFQKDVYADKLCQTGKDIRRVQLELMKRGEPQGSLSAEAGTFRSLSEARLSEAKTCDQIFDLRPDGPSKETRLRSQRLIDETRVGRGTRTTSAEAGTFRSLSGARLSEAKTCEQIFDLRLEYLTAKLRALEREIDGVLTQEVLVMSGCPEGAASAEAGWRRSRQPQLRRGPLGPLAKQG